MNNATRLTLWIVFLLALFCLTSLPLSAKETKGITLKTDGLEDFIGVGSYRVNGKGEIFLFSSRMAKIFKFKPDGTFEKSFCRRGEGPSEITRVLYMYCNPYNNYLYLPEFSSRSKGRITLYDSDGNYQGLLKPEISRKHMDRVQKILFLNDGSYVLVTSERLKWKPVGQYFITQSEILVRYFSKEGKFISQIYTAMDDGEFADAPRYGGPGMLFAPKTIVRLTSNQQIAVGKNSDNKITFHDLMGKKLKTVTLDIERQKLSSEEFEAKKKELVDYMTRRAEPRMAVLARKMVKYDHKPFYASFSVTSKYIILSNITRRDKDGYPLETTLIYFDFDGQKIAEKIFVGSVYSIAEDHVFIHTYDDEHNKRIRLEPVSILAIDEKTDKVNKK